MTREDRERLIAALANFKAATAALDAAWASIPNSGDALEGTYPESLPSFDEFALAVAEMEVTDLEPTDEIEKVSLRPVSLLQVGMRVVPSGIKRACWCLGSFGAGNEQTFDWLFTSDVATVKCLSTGAVANTIRCQLDDGREFHTTYGELNEVTSLA